MKNVILQSLALFSSTIFGIQLDYNIAVAPTPRDVSFGAIGIGVSDLQKSIDFYTSVIGLNVTSTFEVPDWKEVLLSFHGTGKTAICLMKFSDGRYTSTPATKLVFYVPEIFGFFEKVKRSTGSVTVAPKPMAAAGNITVGFARDPDNVILEIIPAATLNITTLPFPISAFSVGTSPTATPSATGKL